MSEYPESERLSKFSDERGAVLEFLEWAEGEGVHLMRWAEKGSLAYFAEARDTLIYRWLEIDPDKLEQERRDMLASLRGEDDA